VRGSPPGLPFPGKGFHPSPLVYATDERTQHNHQDVLSLVQLVARLAARIRKPGKPGGQAACAKSLAGKTTITTATWLPSQELHGAIALESLMKPIALLADAFADGTARFSGGLAQPSRYCVGGR